MQGIRTFILITIALWASLAMAAKTEHYELQFSNSIQAGDVQLQLGNYQVAVEGDSLLFYQGNREVAKVPVKTELLPAKNQATSVSSVQDKITKIRLGGTTMKLVLGNREQAQARPSQ